MTYYDLLKKLEKYNKELDANYSKRHMLPCECFELNENVSIKWNDKADPLTIESVRSEINDLKE